MSTPPMPRCWSVRADWEEWNQFNRETGDRPLDNFCADCLPKFKQQMMTEGRCAYPTVTFIRLVERQYDPRRHARREVTTNALKGVRHET